MVAVEDFIDVGNVLYIGYGRLCCVDFKTLKFQLPFIVIALGEQYSNYAKFLK